MTGVQTCALPIYTGLVSGARLTGDAKRSVYERLWHRPSLAVTALEAMPLATAANQLIAEARG